MTSPTPLAPPAAKPLRADARRNRARILKAARAVFADQGVHSQIDDVAKRAKVGVGTVYRRFEEIAGYAREALEREDAWDGFCELIWRAAELNAADLGFCEVVASTDCTAIVEDIGLMHSTGLLIERAKAQGRMRADATEDDVPLMMVGASSVMQQSPAPDAWRRYFTLMLDGMRAS
jgi:AcrR family transcriptional regulator